MIKDSITAEIEVGNFDNFDTLPEEEKVELMTKWNRKMWIRFSMRNTVNEADVFDPIFRLIEEDDE